MVLVRRRRKRRAAGTSPSVGSVRERIAFVIYCVTLAASPLLFGTVHPLAYTVVFSAILTASILLVLDRLGRDSQTGSWRFRCLRTGMDFLFVAFLAWLLVQTIPLPSGLVGLLSPLALVSAKASVPASQAVMNIPDSGRWISLAPYIYPVRQSMVRWIVYGFLFYGLTQTLTTRRRIEIFVACLLGSVLFDGIYGILVAYGGDSRIWWYRRPRHGQIVSGTFINRNHFAAFMGMGMLLAGTYAAALSASSLKRRPLPNATIRTRLAGLFAEETLITKRAMAILCGAVCVLGVLASGSRGGFVAIVAGWGVLGAAFLFRRGRSPRQRRSLFLATMIVAALCYGLFRGMDLTFERFQRMDEKTARVDRIQYIQRTLALAADYPITGTGAGNFQYAFPRYQTPDMKKQFVSLAHSDWAQLGAETGAVGLLILLVGGFVYVHGTARRWRERRDPFAVWLGALSFGAMGYMAAHSVVDFPLRVPGCFVVFVAMLSVGYAALHIHVRPSGETSKLCYDTLPLKYRGGALFGMLLLTTVWAEVRILRHFVAESSCNTVIDTTRKQDLAPPLGKIRAAIRWDPSNAEYWHRLADNRRILRDTDGVAGLRKAGDREAGTLTEESVAALETAVSLNPLSAQYHQKLALEYSFLDHRPGYVWKWLPAADLSMTRATYFEGEANPWIHKEIGNYWLLRSKSLAPEDERWRDSVERAGLHYRKALSILDGAELKDMRKEIEGFVWNQYPDETFRESLLHGDQGDRTQGG